MNGTSATAFLQKKTFCFYFHTQYFTNTGIYSMYVHLNFEN
ncbi:hypothetical protein BOVAB4_3875 [Bacteroides ovatus]|nr:hypothetical protein BOVAB4_3875 [Bacteroides ovatus]